MEIGIDGEMRCFGNKPGQKFYADYHDTEWGIPVYDDQRLFEMLILEGAQAGLSWETVLKKREGYRRAYYDFDVQRVAKMSDNELETLRTDESIIRNRLKIYAARTNAHAFIQIQKELGTFSQYLWAYVEDKLIINYWQSFAEVPVKTAISDAISRDLKKRGMRFVGATIIYAYMQAVGLVDDHIKGCWCYERNRKGADV
ncbi:MAG: DNA-3-methyladenine glycosylase I [Lentimonas sp.]|jgi:DNA-3-methyladenine glycosylase I